MVKRKPSSKGGPNDSYNGATRPYSSPASPLSQQQQLALSGNAPKYRSNTADYKAPKLLQEPVLYFKGLWELYEATFAISMLETWESILLHSILLTLTYFIYWAAANYLPDHLRIIASRAKYYWQG